MQKTLCRLGGGVSLIWQTGWGPWPDCPPLIRHCLYISPAVNKPIDVRVSLQYIYLMVTWTSTLIPVHGALQCWIVLRSDMLSVTAHIACHDLNTWWNPPAVSVYQLIALIWCPASAKECMFSLAVVCLSVVLLATSPKTVSISDSPRVFLNPDLKLCCSIRLSLNTDPTCRLRLWSYDHVALYKFDDEDDDDDYYKNYRSNLREHFTGEQRCICGQVSRITFGNSADLNPDLGICEGNFNPIWDRGKFRLFCW